MTKIIYALLAVILAVSCSLVSSRTVSDEFQLSEYLDLGRNSYQSNEISSRSDGSLEDAMTEYMKSYDATFKLPLIGSKITLIGRNLDQDELDLKLSFSDSKNVDARKKKSKLKKIFVPIFIIVLLKVITLIPLALGILGLKTWNALQLSFVTFVISISMAVFQLCKKISSDNVPPAIAAHGPWEPHSTHYAARSLDTDAQQMAYSAYTQ